MRYLTIPLIGCLFAALAGPSLAQPALRVAERPLQAAPEHPLDPVLRLARKEIDYLERAVHDYTCRIVKRERIDGTLQTHHIILARVRPAKFDDGRQVRPLAVLLEFQAPRKAAGRRLLFIDGAFDGRMLVRQREGGITFRINPDGGLAARETRMPITTIGIHNMLRGAIEQMEDDIAADPSGDNTRVEWFQNAKIDDRPCMAVRIIHPQRQSDLDFHVAHVFIDEGWRLPVRLDFYNWPAAADNDPILLGEFTYQDVKLNVGLTDADFDHRRLGFHYEE
ncbi:MAG: DUF1571 domain-containing protein [Planctomycetes bacterium]|nr:DUF1571 domain-containing protein [Planctomycetota bacterium]